jgi:hypothetical protein
MRINGVCEYNETCDYEANKIHIRLDSLRSEKKFLRIRRILSGLVSEKSVGEGVDGESYI